MSERVVRCFMASGSIDDLTRYENGGPYKVYGKEYGTDPTKCVPVTVLPHKDGAVGPIERIQATEFYVMLQWLEDADMGLIPFSVLTLHDLHTALSEILGDET